MAEREGGVIDASRLHNWGRWVRVWSREGCGQAWSVEGNYRTKDDDGHDTLTKPGKRPAPDFDDAWDIEIGCRMLPFERHLFLKAAHVLQFDDEFLCKTMRKEAGIRLSTRDLEGYEAMCVALLSQAMERPAVVRMERVRRRVQAIIMPHLTLSPESVS